MYAQSYNNYKYIISRVCTCTAANSSICDSICEKGPFGGNVNIWVRVKNRAKSTFHAITDYCIIGTYSVSPTFRPSLKLVLLSCESNEDRTVSLPRSFCSCTEYIGNVTRTVYDNIYGYTGKDPCSKCIHCDHGSK